MRTALLVGGSGPTGPHLTQGLIDRGYEVALFHRGLHESGIVAGGVEHIHGDPHFAETIENALGDRSFDVVIAAYGRTKLLSRHFRGRAERFFSVGGAPRYAGYYNPEALSPSGVAMPLREDSPLVTAVAEETSKAVAFGHRMVEVERQVFADHPSATHFVYPVIYGPRNVVPREWSIVKRVRDGRRRILLPDDGLALHTRGSARNVSAIVLSALDHPDSASGQIFNCADSAQYSLRQWAEMLVSVAGGRDVELVGVPSAVAPVFASIHLPMPESLCAHDLFDIGKAQRLLGYEQAQTPRDAIRELVDWFAEHPVDRSEYPTFVDDFDYAMEDAVIDEWTGYLSRSRLRFPGPEVDVHPMAHPHRPGADAKGR